MFYKSCQGSLKYDQQLNEKLKLDHLHFHDLLVWTRIQHLMVGQGKVNDRIYSMKHGAIWLFFLNLKLWLARIIEKPHIENFHQAHLGTKQSKESHQKIHYCPTYVQLHWTNYNTFRFDFWDSTSQFLHNLNNKTITCIGLKMHASFIEHILPKSCNIIIPCEHSLKENKRKDTVIELHEFKQFNQFNQ